MQAFYRGTQGRKVFRRKRMYKRFVLTRVCEQRQAFFSRLDSNRRANGLPQLDLSGQKSAHSHCDSRNPNLNSNPNPKPNPNRTHVAHSHCDSRQDAAATLQKRMRGVCAHLAPLAQSDVLTDPTRSMSPPSSRCLTASVRGYWLPRGRCARDESFNVSLRRCSHPSPTSSSS